MQTATSVFEARAWNPSLEVSPPTPPFSTQAVIRPLPFLHLANVRRRPRARSEKLKYSRLSSSPRQRLFLNCSSVGSWPLVATYSAAVAAEPTRSLYVRYVTSSGGLDEPPSTGVTCTPLSHDSVNSPTNTAHVEVRHRPSPRFTCLLIPVPLRRTCVARFVNGIVGLPGKIPQANR